MNNTTTNTTNASNTTIAPVDLKAIKKAEKFLTENFLMGSFYLFCGEIRETGIKEKWDHMARWDAISRWADDQEIETPFSEKPSDIGTALTEWYERIYLPSKWTNKPKRYGKKRNTENSESAEQIEE